MTIPHARDQRPWVETPGNRDGILWAHPGAGRCAVLTWDEAGLYHVATVFDEATVGDTYVTTDRLFDVRRAGW